MKRRICALLAALLLFGAAASAAPAPLPEGMAYLAACRVEGETTGGVTFAVTQAAYDGAVLTLEVLLTPNDGNTALMDNQVELPPEDSWFLKEREKAAALGDRVLGVVCDIGGLTDEKGNNLAMEYSSTTAREGRTMTYTFEVPIQSAFGEVQVELYFGVNEDLGFRFEQDACLLLRVPLFALVPLAAN